MRPEKGNGKCGFYAALGVNKENLLRVVGKTIFEFLKTESDVVFDAEPEFRIRFLF